MSRSLGIISGAFALKNQRFALGGQVFFIFFDCYLAISIELEELVIERQKRHIDATNQETRIVHSLGKLMASFNLFFWTFAQFARVSYSLRCLVFLIMGKGDDQGFSTLSDSTPPEPAAPRIRLRSLLLQGASLVALASICERGLLFLANVLSARVSGPENYGTYGLTLQTAGILASHASLGIGLVATRFAAEYPPGHPQNRLFVQRILQLSFFWLFFPRF